MQTNTNTCKYLNLGKSGSINLLSVRTFEFIHIGSQVELIEYRLTQEFNAFDILSSEPILAFSSIDLQKKTIPNNNSNYWKLS